MNTPTLSEAELTGIHLQLQQQRQRMDELLAQVPGVVWEAHLVPGSTEKSLVYVSRYIECLTGYSVDECLAIPDFWRTIMHPDDRAQASRRAAALLAGELTGSIVFRWRTKDGRELWIESQTAVVRDEAGEPIGLRGINLDVTQRIQAEEAARRQTERLQTIFDHIPVMITCRDREGRLEYVNRQWERTLGWELTRTGSDHLAQIFPDPSERRRAEDHIRAADGRGADYQCCTRDGQLRDIRWTTLRLSDGTTIGLGHDITESKRASVALERLATEMRLLLESTSEGVYGIDLDGRCTFMNPAGLQMLGYQLSEVLSQNVHDLVHSRRPDGSSYPVEDCPIIKVIRRGERCLVETDVFWRKDGSSFPVEYSANPILESGELRGSVITFCNITERLERERRIREQAQLLDLAYEAIMVRDLEGCILFWNRGAERIFGWTAEEAVGVSAAELFDEREKHAVALKAVLERGEWYGELRKPTKRGVTAVVASRWTLLRDERGAPKSILVINSDITEHKKLESQFLRAQRLESIGTLASGVAHDLNNILAPILMSVPVLRNDLPAELRDSILDTVETSAQRGADIVRQVLTFARGAEGQRLLIQPTHLIKEMARIAQETFPKEIEIRASYPNDVWPMEADATQIHQVLLNLCVNARDAMPEGGELVLALKNLHVDENYAAMMPGAKVGPHVVFEVRDTGGGIPHNVVDKIFDPFFTTKDAGKGTGLGLSTAMGIVKSHGGFIHVYSEPGIGTTFRIYLPATPDSTVTADAPKDEHLPRGNGELILLVDDEPSIREVAKAALESQGYRVIVAAEGPDALALFAQKLGEVRVVITDLVMPLMDGVTLIRTLRRMQPGIGIIASTGRLKEKSAKDLAELQVDLCLTKPYSKRDLLKQVHRALGNS